jgi:hypothetical protein
MTCKSGRVSFAGFMGLAAPLYPLPFWLVVDLGEAPAGCGLSGIFKNLRKYALYKDLF